MIGLAGIVYMKLVGSHDREAEVVGHRDQGRRTREPICSALKPRGVVTPADKSLRWEFPHGVRRISNACAERSRVHLTGLRIRMCGESTLITVRAISAPRGEDAAAMPPTGMATHETKRTFVLVGGMFPLLWQVMGSNYRS